MTLPCQFLRSLPPALCERAYIRTALLDHPHPTHLCPTLPLVCSHCAIPLTRGLGLTRRTDLSPAGRTLTELVTPSFIPPTLFATLTCCSEALLQGSPVPAIMRHRLVEPPP